MKEGSIAISVSLLFHIIVVTFFLRVPMDQYLKQKPVLLDFSIQKGHVSDDAGPLNRKAGMKYPEPKAETRQSRQKERTINSQSSIVGRTRDAGNSAVSEPQPISQSGSAPIASDPAGQMVVRGDTGRVGTKSDAATEMGIGSGKISLSTGSSSGSEKILNYESDGADETDFLFIRDTIVRRIKDKYPDQARRMGRQGKVLLSFDVSSNGAIRNVTIISSSGSRILDDNAKEAVEKTTFNQRIPYARRVRLPVEYRLQSN